MTLPRPFNDYRRVTRMLLEHCTCKLPLGGIEPVHSDFTKPTRSERRSAPKSSRPVRRTRRGGVLGTDSPSRRAAGRQPHDPRPSRHAASFVLPQTELKPHLLYLPPTRRPMASIADRGGLLRWPISCLLAAAGQ